MFKRWCGVLVVCRSQDRLYLRRSFPSECFIDSRKTQPTSFPFLQNKCSPDTSTRWPLFNQLTFIIYCVITWITWMKLSVCSGFIVATEPETRGLPREKETQCSSMTTLSVDILTFTSRWKESWRSSPRLESIQNKVRQVFHFTYAIHDMSRGSA